MTTLKEYLREENLTQAQFAAQIDESLQNVNRWVNGERTPKKATVRSIHAFTNGRVSYADWYVEEPQRSSPVLPRKGDSGLDAL